MNLKHAWRLIFVLPGADGFVIRKWGRSPPNPRGMAAQARYCYAVWLSHLVHACESASLPSPPRSVVEIGPGSSLGAGLAALLSGASEYRGLDVVEHAAPENNLRVFDELVELFRRRERIPGGDEFQRMAGLLENRDFPAGVLDSERLRDALRPERAERLRQAVERGGPEVSYIVPWSEADIKEEASISSSRRTRWSMWKTCQPLTNPCAGF